MDLVVELVNQKLYERGRSLDGRPIWRIVWSPDQYEKRLGTFSDFYGKIFLRERTEVRVVRKYWHLEPRWVLERLTFIPPGSPLHRELISQGSGLDIHTPVVNGSYEPIYVFQDKHGNYLPVLEIVVDQLLHFAEFGERIKKSDDTMREEFDAELEEDSKYFEAKLHDWGRSPLFAHGNSVYIEKGI